MKGAYRPKKVKVLFSKKDLDAKKIEAMLFYSLILGLTLHGSFSSEQAQHISPNNRITRKVYVPGTVVGVVTPTRPPSVLVASKNDELDIFHHYNYTMTRCFWSQPSSIEEKATTFMDLIVWLQNFNQTLNATFVDEEDALAWGIIEGFGKGNSSA